jgi:hypothetical protein
MLVMLLKTDTLLIKLCLKNLFEFLLELDYPPFAVKSVISLRFTLFPLGL